MGIVRASDDSYNNASMGADVWEPFARTNQFDRAQARARG